LAYARWWLPKAIDRSDVLRTFQRFKHEDAIRDFDKLDDLARATASSRVRQGIAHDLPSPDGVPRQSELGLLRHQMNLKRPSRSIREVIASMPETFGKLAPCLLMSPLSIAQYLPAGQALFDVVVFDEASQITTWDAIGAIARGRQTIIVGDPKQLPPTNFFGRSDDDAENDELEDHEKDLESILDESQASGLPTLQLNWHYRSRHESLIAFSNWHYYGNKLVTFPAAESVDRGVSLRHLPDSKYDRGKSRTNRDEAEAIVQDAVSRMRRCLELPESERLTFGVITFNSQQQSLIQDLFDQAQREDPSLDWYFSDERIEPTVVKNLENVQGDERDVMFFSITFGPDASTRRLPLTFGALNRDGGERRLNVAVTRARRQLIVYSSFRADQLDAGRTEKRGVRDLKNFLEYAEKGPIAIFAKTDGSVGGYESPFEEAVADALVAKGWQVIPQVGVSGFRVDLGIVHPDKPGAYLAGIECDGATYHRAAVARDRDKTRQEVLVNLGWNILRVWSPDWWYDPDSAVQRVDQALVELLKRARTESSDNGH
jgi:very-short-patch-repair endonuclease